MTHTYTNKLPKDSRESTEAKILQRGEYYLTPFTLDHIDEVVENLSQENRRELILLGYSDIRDAIYDMHKSSECYLARKVGESFLMVGGLWFTEDQDFPQMFSMFSKDFAKHFTAIAHGSRMLVSFFDQTQQQMTMTILSDYEFMLRWANWLGFENVGVVLSNGNKYVEFVRCNPNQKDVYDCTLQPVIH